MVTAVEDPPQSAGGVLLSKMEEGFWRGKMRVAVLVRLDGRIDEPVLTRALARVQQRHPKLRSVIAQGADQRFRYHPDPAAAPIACRVYDCADGETPWRDETRRLLDLDPPPAGPVAAVTVLRSRAGQCSELILCAHHGIADGRSGLVLADDILTEYANAESHPPVPPRPERPIVSSVHATRSPRWRDRLWLLRRFVRLQRAESRSQETALPTGRDIPPLSQWVRWAFTRADTLALVRRCRKERVSPSGAMVAAVYSSLLECLPLPEALFKWQCPFDVRDNLQGPAGPVGMHDLGSFIGLMRSFDTVRQPVPFWDVARKVHGDLQAFVQHGGPGISYKLSSLAVDRRGAPVEQALVRSGFERPTLFFTNYGVVSIRDAYGSLRPQECTLTFKDEDGAGPRLILEVLVLGQCLNVGLSADGLEPAFWERLHAAVRGHLHAAADA